MAQQKLIIDQANAPEATEKKRRKAPLILAGLGVIALVPIIGSTFAASITLGSGNVEFGQGTQTAAACDSHIDVALAATVASADFTNTTLTLKNFDTTACSGKKITIRIADASNVLLGIGASSATTAQFTVADSDGSISGTGCTAVISSHGTTGQAVITFASTVAPTSVAKVLLESTN
jgi:hypothetical protein